MSAVPVLVAYAEDGAWWVRCKHGERTGPYRDKEWADLAASMLLAAHGRCTVIS
jgi:hypothetical protein